MKNVILATAAAVILSAPLAFAASTTLAPAPKPLKTAATSLSAQCTANAEGRHR